MSELYYVHKKTLCQILGVSRSKIERDVAAGLLPKPYKLGKRTIAWRSDELKEYLDSFPRIENAYDSYNKKSCKTSRANSPKDDVK